MTADFVQILMDMRSGAVANDLNIKFNDVLTGVLETGGKGELTVKFKVEPSKYGFGGAVVEVDIQHDVKLKRPELKIGTAKFYVTKDGRLTRQDPSTAGMEPMFQESEKEKTRGV